MTREHDDALTPTIRRLRADAEAIHAARIPDFAAMMARARELDAAAVSAADAAAAEALAPVIPLQRHHHDRHDAEVLAPFTAATRAELSLRPAGSPRPPGAPPAPRRARVAALASLAAAAAIALFTQLPQRVAHLLAPTRSDVAALAGSADEAAQRATTTPRERTSAAARPAPAEAPWTPGTSLDAPPPDASRDPTSLDTPLDATSPEASRDATSPDAPLDARDASPLATPTPPERSKPPSRRPGASTSTTASSPASTPPTSPPPAASLEDEAQALWQRGELAAAEHKLREVVRVAGKSARAELAYGDLFALAGQLRGADGQVALAREYLAAFPRGRFAEDMRAGLCQRAALDVRPTCWRDYLENHPAGAHRRAAEAALADGPPP
jgi:hypothetical protein